MLNKNEEKTLYKYHFATVVAKYSVGAMVFLVILKIAFNMIIFPLLHVPYYSSYTFFYEITNSPIPLVAFLLIAVFFIIYSGAILSKAQSDPSWQDLEAKIDAYLINNGLEDRDNVSLADLAKARRRSSSKLKRELGLEKVFLSKDRRVLVYKIETAFDIYAMPLPKRSLIFKIAVIVLLVLNFAVYLPVLYNGLTYRSSTYQKIEAAMEKFDAVFEDECYGVYADDLEYDEYGYYYSAYLNYDMDDSIMIDIDNEAKIKHVYYSFDFDMRMSMEENLSAAQEAFDKYHEMLVASNVEAKNDRYLQRPLILEDFKEELLALGDNLTNIDYSKDNFRIAFYADDEYSDYCHLYIDIY